MYLGISTDTERRAINTHNCRCCATYQCLSLPGVSQSSYASFPLHKNSVHSNRTHVQISCKCTQWHSLQWRIVVVQLHHRLDTFQRLYSNKTKPIPLCQSQTCILLGLNHQQPLWVSHHRYTKEPPLTPLFHG